METTKTIKVLIADDESIVRKGLRSTVPWDKYGMEVVADAPSGRKAWEAFLEHRPEVVITDIVMPEMDGIELSRRIKEKAPNTKIILLSCHRDFEYAQQGMKLGASGYLLKTAFEDEELEDMLEKFQRELTTVSESVAPAETASDQGERLSTLLYAWLNGHNDKFIGEMEKRTREEWYFHNEPVYIYLVKTSGCESSWVDLLKEAAYEDRRFYEGAIIPYGQDRCYCIVAKSDLNAVDMLLVEQKSKSAKLQWARRGPLLHAEERLQAWSALHQEAELEKIHSVSAVDWPDAIWRAVKLLHDNPAAEWSVSDVARQVGLSRSHFSILFKKAVGDSFVAFQYKRKLKLAYMLLKDTTLTMQDIAERTGLGDSKYFSKWFKRCTGQTPSHYRTQQKSGTLLTDVHLPK
ncbi:response regulator transcription factor [Paenibacillus macquariensis]|uniref:Two-component system, response regulator YesN n=1 Tax=Paenibacillus macquariensis TaxID=948756 RepID=A0ABY1K825_9BACL|nr:response regulator [Paenibacillus macquariensis]MEC0091195.1 response regulator [Paenibacillus macquariensis]OAB33626.1 DNA-binding response regulator [Paenibacillus macquariensis subsp. macquariensis]SIR38919.1 two-component system, response regulator YesN [Paenibacillus macquariensis]